MTRPRHVVVVGHGMAAARLAEAVRERDPRAERVTLTIVGAEPRRAYNRVLLPHVLAGRLGLDDVWLHDDGWERAHGVAARRGIGAVALDRGRRLVRLADGGALGYDDLVIATGSRPFLPPVDGLRADPRCGAGTPHPRGTAGSRASGVTAFRTIEDCRRIVAAALAGARVIVLGAGLLGIEAARALAERGAHVTLVQSSNRLMPRQLDHDGARVLVRLLRELDVEVRLDARAARWQPDRAHGGLVLADGAVIPGDLLVVSTGVRPRTGLAIAAGLRTERGIVVDDLLATSDPRVRAIGDCAQHPGAESGLVQPAWEQAGVLADLLTRADPAARYRGTATVTRLKAAGIELATMGNAQQADDGAAGPSGAAPPAAGAAGGEHRADPLAEHPGGAAEDTTEVLRFDDPRRGRYAKLALRDDRVTGAIMIGLPDAAATVTQLYDSGDPAPADRLALLLGRALPAGPAAGATAAASLPDDALLCRCNTVTKGALAAAWRRGATSVPDLARATRATTGCGGCVEAVTGLARWLGERRPNPGIDGTEIDSEEEVA